MFVLFCKLLLDLPSGHLPTGSSSRTLCQLLFSPAHIILSILLIIIMCDNSQLWFPSLCSVISASCYTNLQFITVTILNINHCPAFYLKHCFRRLDSVSVFWWDVLSTYHQVGRIRDLLLVPGADGRFHLKTGQNPVSVECVKYE
jgi:hypothetical protein